MKLTVYDYYHIMYIQNKVYRNKRRKNNNRIILYFTKNNDHGHGNNKINLSIIIRLLTLQRIKNMIIMKQNNSILIFYTIFIIFSLKSIKMYFFF